MNYLKKYYLVLVVVLSCTVLAQTTDEIGIIKSNLIKIFELSLKPNYAEAAGYFAKISDKNEISTIDNKIPGEFINVKRMCKSISALINISNVYDINTPFKEVFNKINTFAVMVNFNSGAQVISKKFRFVKVGEKFLLLKID